MTYNVSAATAPLRSRSGGAALEIKDLVKTYTRRGGGTFNAVDEVSFEVGGGELFGLLGPNGAGKTTTLEIAEGIREPSSGSAVVLGLDSMRDREQLKRRIGVQLQAGSYFNYLTLREILELFGSFYPRRREPEELLGQVALLDKAGAQVRHLSGGQARRFSVGAALVSDPDVLFLDEPTTGLDPAARRTMWELIRRVNREQGKTVVLTTHYMEEAELLADRIAVIDHGRLQAIDTPEALIASYGGAGKIRFATERQLELCDLRALPGIEDAIETRASDIDGAGAYAYVLRTPDSRGSLAELLAWCEREGVALRALEAFPGTLEDVFLELTGRALRD